MKSFTVVAKAGALVSFAVLMTCYVAYESGAFTTPALRQSNIALAGMNTVPPDSTEAESEADSLARQRRKDSVIRLMAGSKSMSRVLDDKMISDFDAFVSGSTATRKAPQDSSKKNIRYMGSSKSRMIFQTTTTGTTAADTATKQNHTP